MDKHFFYDLVDRYLDGTATPDEKKLVEAYYDQLSNSETPVSAEKKVFLKEQILKNIQQEIQPVIPVQPIRWKRWIAAASLLAVLGLGYWLFTQNSFVKSNPDFFTERPADIDAPVANSAIITLANGQQLKLAELNKGILLKEGQVSVIKKTDDVIIYDYPGLADNSQMQYNILSNPRNSRVVAITLSDGTKVWLNTESSLRYPVVFNKEVREVEVLGEAYFEVARNDQKKFIVNGKGFLTEVLGTHFNVNTYRDDGLTKITLLEGLVKVYNSGPDKNNVKLKPGQQAKVGGSVIINDNVDLDEVMAWKNGSFKFNKVGIQVVMKQLERWFDLQVKYQAGVPEFLFVGELSRELSLLKILAILEKSGVEFRLEGRTLTVL